MIRRQLDPFLNRIATIDNRIKYFHMLRDELSKIKSDDVKIKVLKENKRDSVLIVEDKIILQKRIGSPSKYGIVYYSHLDDTSINKLFKFATKIMEDDKDNREELRILIKLTNAVVDKVSPHFPIIYKDMVWKDFKSNEKKRSLPTLVARGITKKIPLLLVSNEIADGDFNMFRSIHYENDELLLNAFMQIIISIFSFYKVLNSYHHDCHSGNFLFHKIKPGGFIHYKNKDIDFYIENKGYLWFIWDFGFTKTFEEEKDKVHMYEDLNRIIATNLNPKGSAEKKYPFTVSFYNYLRFAYDFIIARGTPTMKQSKDMEYFFKDLLDFFIENNFIINDKPDNIINDVPYIIF